MTIRATIVVNLLIAVMLCSTVKAQGPLFAEKLFVDFTNNESRSISVRLGSVDNITAGMNFAVLDSADMQIAVFYPHEILTDRFWSGPLKPEDFARIRLGDPVIRIELGLTRSAILREQFAVRMTVLKEEMRRKRLKLLDEEKADLEEKLNELTVEQFHLDSDLASLQEDLKREKSRVQRQAKELQDQVNDLRDERSELAEDRQDLLERREDYLKRKDPPQERISDLNEDIADLDRKIGRINIDIDDLRVEMRELQEESRDVQDEIASVKEERRELDVKRAELELELKKVEREMVRVKEEGRP